jgi:chemotaxis protein methyltransferase CheR
MSAAGALQDREFAFTDAHFHAVRDAVRKHAGIQLSDAKRELVYGRLRKRLRALGLDSFDRYLQVLSAPGSQEFTDFVNALTTNHTSFFREAHHFEYLEQLLVQQLASGQKRIRIWSSACSTGQEPYSIAITLAKVLGRRRDVDAKILATDIDTNVLARAATGCYRADALNEEELGYMRPHMTQQADGGWCMRDELRSLITFRQLNLLEPWPVHGPFDVIFCRNVVIYFDNATKLQLVDRFADLLAPHGRLFMGHAESLVSARKLKLVGRTAYARA